MVVFSPVCFPMAQRVQSGRGGPHRQTPERQSLCAVWTVRVRIAFSLFSCVTPSHCCLVPAVSHSLTYSGRSWTDFGGMRNRRQRGRAPEPVVATAFREAAEELEGHFQAPLDACRADPKRCCWVLFPRTRYIAIFAAVPYDHALPRVFARYGSFPLRLSGSRYGVCVCVFVFLSDTMAGTWHVNPESAALKCQSWLG